MLTPKPSELCLFVPASAPVRELTPFGPDGHGGYATALEVTAAGEFTARQAASGTVRAVTGDLVLAQPDPAARSGGALRAPRAGRRRAPRRGGRRAPAPGTAHPARARRVARRVRPAARRRGGAASGPRSRRGTHAARGRARHPGRPRPR